MGRELREYREVGADPPGKGADGSSADTHFPTKK